MTATTRILHKAEDLRYGYDWTPPEPEPWRADAMCRGRADWLNHTPPTSAARRRRFAAEVEERKALCDVCPVRRQRREHEGRPGR